MLDKYTMARIGQRMNARGGHGHAVLAGPNFAGDADVDRHEMSLLVLCYR